MTPSRAYFKVKHRRPARSPHPPASSTSPARTARPKRQAPFLLILGGAALAIVLLLAARLSFALSLLWSALFMVAVLEPVVAFFEKHGWPRFTGVLAVLVLAAAPGFVVWQFMAPALAQEAKLSTEVLVSPKAEQWGARALAGLAGIFPGLQHAGAQQRVLAEYAGLRENLAHSTSGLITALFTGGLALALLTILVGGLLWEAPRLRRSIIEAVPNRRWESTVLYLHALPVRLLRFWRVQVLAALGVAVLLTLAFYLMQLPCFLLLGMIAGLSTFTPYFGSLLGAAITLMLTVMTTGAYNLTFPILISFALVDLLKNAVFSLRALKGGLVLGPLETFLGMLFGGSLAGWWGTFFAALLFATIKIVLQESLKSMRSFHPH